MKWFRSKSPRPDPETILAAIEANQLTELDQLLTDFPSLLEKSTPLGLYPLLAAVLHGQPPIVQHLLERGANLYRVDRHGGTLLMLAVQRQLLEIVRLLLQHGAEVNQRDHEGDTALIYASGGRSPELVSILLEAGADTQARNFDGLRALDKALHPPIISLLQQHSQPDQPTDK